MHFTKLFLASISALLISTMSTYFPGFQARLQDQLQAAPQTTPVARLAVAQNQQESRNWSGYAATNGTFTSIQATWTLRPNTTVNNYGNDATWVGIGGVDTNDLIQAGTQQTVTPDGHVSYEAFYEKLPDISQPIDLAVSPGDTVTTSVKQVHDADWQITIANNTTQQKVIFYTSYTSSRSSADWIEEAPSGTDRILPLDNFGTIEFKSATTTENGREQTLLNAHAQPIAMSNDFGQTLAQASVISHDGRAFTVTRTNTQTTGGTTSYAELPESGGGVPFIIHRLRYFFR